MAGFLSLLDQTAEQQRASITQSDAGDELETWAAIATGVPCSIQQGSGSRRAEDGGYVQVERWRGFFLIDSDVQPGDRIVARGVTYTVEAVDAIRSHHLEASMRPTAAA